MIGWLAKMFTTKYSKLKLEAESLAHDVHIVRSAEQEAQDRLRTTLVEAKYRPSPLAESLGWKRHG